jgi:hypothetical protein
VKLSASSPRFLKTTDTFGPNVFPALAEKAEEISVAISDKDSLEQLSKELRSTTRTDIYLTSETIGKVVKQNKISDPPITEANRLQEPAREDDEVYSRLG